MGITIFTIAIYAVKLIACIEQLKCISNSAINIADMCNEYVKARITHTNQVMLSVLNGLKLMSKFYYIEEITILKGGKLSNKFPAAFSRNIAFRCNNKNP